MPRRDATRRGHCATLPKATQLLYTQVSVDETIAEEVSKCGKAAGKFKLVDLLTVPMQRILKYHMLLQRLVGQTQASHEEYHSIEQAYNCIINVSEVSL